MSEIERLRAANERQCATILALVEERERVGAVNSHRQLRAVVADMLAGLAYLRATDSVPYGFGIDRLEETGRAALADPPTIKATSR